MLPFPKFGLGTTLPLVLNAAPSTKKREETNPFCRMQLTRQFMDFKTAITRIGTTDIQRLMNTPEFIPPSTANTIRTAIAADVLQLAEWMGIDKLKGLQVARPAIFKWRQTKPVFILYVSAGTCDSRCRATCFGPSIRRAPLLTSCFRQCATQRPPNGGFARR